MSGIVTRAVAMVANAWSTAREQWQFGTRPRGGRIYEPSTTLDSARNILTEGLNFTRLRSYLASADAGDLAAGLGLLEEMTEKDIHLAGVTETRIRALTGLDYEITSDAEAQRTTQDRRRAEIAAEYCKEVLSGVQSFQDLLEHLAMAAISNLAVAEIVWEKFAPVDFGMVPSWRLNMVPSQWPGVVLIKTPKNMIGVPATPGKFIVFIPRNPKEFPFRRSALRAQAFVYLVKQLAIVDWSAFLEIFGMPMRWATFKTNATREEKEELLAMLKGIGSRAYGAFSEAVQFELKESSQRGTQPFEPLINWCDRKQSILFLGGNLTADTTGGTGTFAAASVQDEVRNDLRDDDIRRESRVIREQLLTPMVHYHWPNMGVPVPHFERIKPETVDRQAEANLFATAQRAGIRIPKAWAHTRLNIPEPKADEEALVPSLDAFGAGLTEGGADEQ